MNEIICPNCKTAFKVDEAGFASILKQVRDDQFNEELKTRLALADTEKQNAIQIAESNLKINLQAEISNKDQEISILRELDHTTFRHKKTDCLKRSIKWIEIRRCKWCFSFEANLMKYLKRQSQ